MQDDHTVEVNQTPSEQFKNLKDAPGIKWEYTLTRKEMAEVKKKSKEDLAEELDTAPEPDQKPGTGDGGMDE